MVIKNKDMNEALKNQIFKNNLNLEKYVLIKINVNTQNKKWNVSNINSTGMKIIFLESKWWKKILGKRKIFFLDFLMYLLLIKN